MSRERLWLRAEAAPGAHVRYAAEAAIELAGRLGVGIELPLGGETLLITEGGTPEAIEAELLHRRHERSKREREQGRSTAPAADALDPAPVIRPGQVWAEGKADRPGTAEVRSVGPGNIVHYTARDGEIASLETGDCLGGHEFRCRYPVLILDAPVPAADPDWLALANCKDALRAILALSRVDPGADRQWLAWRMGVIRERAAAALGDHASEATR